MTLEQILVLAVLALAFLLNVLLRALRRRLPGEAPPASEPEAPAAPARVRTLSSSLGARRDEAGIIAPRLPPPDVLRLQRRPRVRIASARQARGGFMLMAVLGPCRGLERL